MSVGVVCLLSRFQPSPSSFSTKLGVCPHLPAWTPAPSHFTLSHCMTRPLLTKRHLSPQNWITILLQIQAQHPSLLLINHHLCKHQLLHSKQCPPSNNQLLHSQIRLPLLAMPPCGETPIPVSLSPHISTLHPHPHLHNSTLQWGLYNLSAVCLGLVLHMLAMFSTSLSPW